MAVTYQQISTFSLGSNSSTIDITGIPSGYTDLRAVFRLGGTGNFFMQMRLNSITTSSYRNQILKNYNAAAYDSSFQFTTFISLDEVTIDSYPGMSSYILDFRRYSGTHSVKSLLWSSTNYARANNAMSTIRGVATVETSSAISSINLIAGSNAFASGSIVTLYGITEA
jgi:hypothetical protein